MSAADSLARIRVLFNQGFERLPNQLEIAALSTEALAQHDKDIADITNPPAVDLPYNDSTVPSPSLGTTVQAALDTAKTYFAPALVAIVNESATTHTVTSAENGHLIICSNASGCAVKVDHTLPIGTSVAVARTTGAGAVTLDNDSAATTFIKKSTTVTPPTCAAVGSIIAFTITATATAFVTGDLLLS